MQYSSTGVRWNLNNILYFIKSEFKKIQASFPNKMQNSDFVKTNFWLVKIQIYFLKSEFSILENKPEFL